MHPALAALLQSRRCSGRGAARTRGAVARRRGWPSRGAEGTEVDHLVVALALCFAEALHHRGHARRLRRWHGNAGGHRVLPVGLQAASADAEVRVQLGGQPQARWPLVVLNLRRHARGVHGQPMPQRKGERAVAPTRRDT